MKNIINSSLTNTWLNVLTHQPTANIPVHHNQQYWSLNNNLMKVKFTTCHQQSFTNHQNSNYLNSSSYTLPVQYSCLFYYALCLLFALVLLFFKLVIYLVIWLRSRKVVIISVFSPSPSSCMCSAQKWMTNVPACFHYSQSENTNLSDNLTFPSHCTGCYCPGCYCPGCYCPGCYCPGCYCLGVTVWGVTVWGVTAWVLLSGVLLPGCYCLGVTARGVTAWVLLSGVLLSGVLLPGVLLSGVLLPG